MALNIITCKCTWYSDSEFYIHFHFGAIRNVEPFHWSVPVHFWISAEYYVQRRNSGKYNVEGGKSFFKTYLQGSGEYFCLGKLQIISANNSSIVLWYCKIITIKTALCVYFHHLQYVQHVDSTNSQNILFPQSLPSIYVDKWLGIRSFIPWRSCKLPDRHTIN